MDSASCISEKQKRVVLSQLVTSLYHDSMLEIENVYRATGNARAALDVMAKHSKHYDSVMTAVLPLLGEYMVLHKELGIPETLQGVLEDDANCGDDSSPRTEAKSFMAIPKVLHFTLFSFRDVYHHIFPKILTWMTEVIRDRGVCEDSKQAYQKILSENGIDTSSGYWIATIHDIYQRECRRISHSR
jgi:hypothetical protein